MASIYYNLCALEVSSVESLIVARSCLPLAMSILDYYFLGRQVSSSLLLGQGLENIQNFIAPSQPGRIGRQSHVLGNFVCCRGNKYARSARTLGKVVVRL